MESPTLPQQNTNPYKPGYQTSELWLSVLSMALTVLAGYGVIKSTDVNPIINAVAAIYTGGVAMLTFYAIVRSYGQGRVAIKTQMLSQAVSK